MTLHTAYIGLGANLSQPREMITTALVHLNALPQTRLLLASSFYAAAPVDADGDDYVNAVAALETGLDPQALLTALQQIEAQLGRVRSYQNAPRTIDCDLLLFDQQIIANDTLQVPHPRMHQRAFVLLPLLEIAPSIALPGLGPAQHYLTDLSTQRIHRLA